jgi:hypothetical protein
MYKTETHMHTAECSACASATGAQQAEQYKALGYSTIIVTDHFFNGNTTVSRDLPWEERIGLFCRGYENAKKRGEEIGLNVLFGLEYAWNGADFLAYGIDGKWLKDNPDLLDIPVQEFCNRVHANGGAVVHAHPFREAEYITEMKFLPDYCDGVEVYNAGNRERIWDGRAKWYAEQYGLTQTAGSDCHHIGGDRFFATLTEFEITDISQYCAAVKGKEISGLFVPEKYR